MKARSKIFPKTIILVLMAALTLVICFPVAADTNTTLTTTVPETLPLLLELSGNGTVTINGVAYTQFETIEVPRNATIELQITPNAGNEIKSVIYNDCDFTSEAKSGKITISDITENATLRIVFSEITSVPITGDSRYHAPCLLAVLMIASLMGILAVLSFKKKNIH